MSRLERSLTLKIKKSYITYILHVLIIEERGSTHSTMLLIKSCEEKRV